MTEIVFGPLGSLATHLPRARKVLVLASSARHVAAARAALAAFDLAVFDGAKVHVPIETVTAAEAAVAAERPDTLVAIGGGSPIGLAKALRLSDAPALTFAAVPTTYAGSERTKMYGITRGRDKQTGKDDRVRPDLVLYDVELTLGMPLALTVQSLFNAIAHVASAISTDSLDAPSRAEGVAAVHDVAAALATLVRAPDDRPARALAQRAASTCADVYDRGKAGLQHQLAHLLGGAFNLEHSALHALLLPHFLAHARIADLADLDLGPLLATAGAPTTLSALGVAAADLDAVLAARPELAPIARAAL